MAGESPRGAREEGIAILVALMAVSIMCALGAGLILAGTSETLIAANFRASTEAAYAADAAFEHAFDDLVAVDWALVTSGAVKSAFVDGAPSGTRRLIDGSTIDLARVAPDSTWQLYAFGSLRDLLPAGSIESPCYVIVMVKAIPSDPSRLVVRTEAFGVRNAHAVTEATLDRPAGGSQTRVASWRLSP